MHPPTPDAIAPACPEAAKTASCPEGRVLFLMRLERIVKPVEVLGGRTHGAHSRDSQSPCYGSRPCVTYDHRLSPLHTAMDTTPLYVLKRPDGSFKYYVDQDYAQEQGVSVDKLICVEVPNTIYAHGSVDDLSTYVAQQLEQRGP